jgi:TatD DNase family protein
MLIDVHCHINSLNPTQREYFSKGLRDDFIFIDASIDYPTSIESLRLSSNFGPIWSCLGFHPSKVGEFRDTILEDYKKMSSSSKKIVGIGEVGIDYKVDVPLEDQRRVFESFIDLAKETNLPLIIHNRYDPAVILDILNQHLDSFERVVFHCFSQHQDFLAKILDKNEFASFSLNILREKREIIDALKIIPLDNLLLETDSPYIYIGKRRSLPQDIEEVYSFVCRLKDLDLEELQMRVYLNAKRVFRLEL